MTSFVTVTLVRVVSLVVKAFLRPELLFPHFSFYSVGILASFLMLVGFFGISDKFRYLDFFPLAIFKLNDSVSFGNLQILLLNFSSRKFFHYNTASVSPCTCFVEFQSVQFLLNFFQLFIRAVS